MALLCNAVSHWLGAYTEWSLLAWYTFFSSLFCLFTITNRNRVMLVPPLKLWIMHPMVITGNTGIIPCTCPANERRRYIVMSSLIGWEHTKNYPWVIAWIPVVTCLGKKGGECADIVARMLSWPARCMLHYHLTIFPEEFCRFGLNMFIYAQSRSRLLHKLWYPSVDFTNVTDVCDHCTFWIQV